MKNKTVAAWLAFLGGPLGLHRFYLHGARDLLGWLLPIPTLIGLYGLWRAREFGLDDQLSWALIPFIGFTIAGCALTAIVFGLMSAEKWNARYNPGADPEATCGQTSWITIFAIVLALMFGAGVLMASIAFSIQRYFEYQVDQARLISQ